MYPPYSLNLNVIEYIWAGIKDYIGSNFAENHSDNDLINAIKEA